MLKVTQLVSLALMLMKIVESIQNFAAEMKLWRLYLQVSVNIT